MYVWIYIHGEQQPEQSSPALVLVLIFILIPMLSNPISSNTVPPLDIIEERDHVTWHIIS
jgi:hypothetical protein